MIKGIIFDLDDTLLKTQQTKFQALKAVGKQFYGLDITDEHLRAHWGKPMHTFMDEAFSHADKTERLLANYMSMVMQFHNEAYEGAITTLNQLKSQYKLGILSSASRALIEHDLHSSGLDLTLFTHIQSSEDTHIHKPDPLVFEPLLEQFSKKDILPHELLYVGDMSEDYQASTRAGLQFIAMADRTTPKHVFDELGASSIASFSELPTYLGLL